MCAGLSGSDTGVDDPQPRLARGDVRHAVAHRDLPHARKPVHMPQHLRLERHRNVEHVEIRSAARIEAIAVQAHRHHLGRGSIHLHGLAEHVTARGTVRQRRRQACHKSQFLHLSISICKWNNLITLQPIPASRNSRRQGFARVTRLLSRRSAAIRAASGPSRA